MLLALIFFAGPLSTPKASTTGNNFSVRSPSISALTLRLSSLSNASPILPVTSKHMAGVDASWPGSNDGTRRTKIKKPS